jgi:hypothetical protein
MDACIEYSPVNGDTTLVVMTDKIVHLTKNANGDVTYIHCMNGDILEAEDSVRTLSARINSPLPGEQHG